MSYNSYNSLSGISAELKAIEKKKREASKEELEHRITDLAKLLRIEIVKEELNNNYEVYKGNYSGKEIRISSAKNSKVKKILIFDTMTLNILYTGNFTEEAEHYLAIIKGYNKKNKGQTGYYKKY